MLYLATFKPQFDARTLWDAAGEDAVGQLGDGAASGSSSKPLKVVGGHSFSALGGDARFNHTCAIALQPAEPAGTGEAVW